MPEGNKDEGPHMPPTKESHRIAIAFVVACAFLMQGVDTTLLTIAIPLIARDLGQSPLSLHLLITAYLLSLAVFMPVSGWFADRFGARRVFCWSVALFMTASMACAAMPGLWTMLPLRMLQGFGGALMTPVGRMIVLRAFGPGRTLDGMTWLTIPVLIGPLIGPLIGATLIEFAPWRTLFFVNAPICLAAIIGALRLIPATPPEGAGAFDLGGFALAGLSLVLFQLGVEALSHPGFGLVGAVVLVAGSLAVFQVYRRHARGLDRPALDLRLFSNASYRTGVIAGGIGRIGINSSAFLLPLFLQLGLGFRPIHAGLLAALSGLGSFASKPLLKRCVARFGFRRVLIAITLLGTLSLLAFAGVSTAWPLGLLIALVLITGAIRTLYFNAANTLTYTDLQDGELSRAVSSAGVFQQLTMGLGISISAALLAVIQTPGGALQKADFHWAFAAMGLIPLLSLPVLWRYRDTGAAPAVAEAPATLPVAPAAPVAPMRKTQAPLRNKSIGERRAAAETDHDANTDVSGTAA
ncbi:MFS transporter [Mesobacterium pallidum]|uniref:MFS transporter n=1 Tax=Mesobacterium pallidum TaxID=2872037 RepID=UPI001EE2F1D5|nr:MFS transporter [Mesobacterium pallidum]